MSDNRTKGNLRLSSGRKNRQELKILTMKRRRNTSEAGRAYVLGRIRYDAGSEVVVLRIVRS